MAGMCTAPPQWPGGRCLSRLAFPLTLAGMLADTWARVVSPNPGTANTLSGVAATSAGNAWTWALHHNHTTRVLGRHCC